MEFSVRVIDKSANARFTVELPATLDLDGWECSLVECYLTAPKTPATGLAVVEIENLITGSIINREVRPLLGIYPLIRAPNLYSSPSRRYHKIKPSRVDFLTFTLRDADGEKLIFDRKEVYLHLHFRVAAAA